MWREETEIYVSVTSPIVRENQRGKKRRRRRRRKKKKEPHNGKGRTAEGLERPDSFQRKPISIACIHALILSVTTHGPWPKVRLVMQIEEYIYSINSPQQTGTSHSLLHMLHQSICQCLAPSSLPHEGDPEIPKIHLATYSRLQVGTPPFSGRVLWA